MTLFRLVWVVGFLCTGLVEAQSIGLLKYRGGGDWYANPTALGNLIEYCNQTLGTSLEAEPITVEPGSNELYSQPFVHMTGHGNVVFSEGELDHLRKWLDGGGFLHVDDNYGMDPFVRPFLELLFEDSPLEKIPPDHPIFSKPFAFPEGLPKVHEHNNKAPEAWGIFRNGRLVLLYSFESDLGDGWEDPGVHNDPEELRQQALKMGANLVWWAFVR